MVLTAIYWVLSMYKYECLVCCCSLVAKSCLTFCNPMHCSPPGSSVHENFQARILEWVAISFSSGSSRPRDSEPISCIGRQILYHWATREAQLNLKQTYQFSSVQFSSVVQLCLTICDAMDCSTPGFPITNSWSLLKLMSIESVMPSSHLTLCRPLLLLPSIFPSIRVFSSESVLCIKWPKYWSISFSISPSNEYSGLISFRRDWLDLLAVQGTLKRILQHHSSKASILQCSAFFMVQHSHPYMTTGKNHSFGYKNLCQQSNVSTF